MEGSRLYFSRLIPEDSGTYACIARNSSSRFSMTSSTALLNVIWIDEETRAGPSSEGSSSHDYPRTGDSFSLRCRSKNRGGTLHEWFRNGDPVISGTAISVSQHHLHFTNLSPAKHNGVYSCRVFAVEKGETLSSRIHVPYVLALKGDDIPNILTVPMPVLVPLGGRATFHCQYEADTLLEWYHNDHGPILGTERISVSGNGSLVIRDVNKSDDGFYKCVGVHPLRSFEQAFGAALTVANIGDEMSFEPDLPNGESYIVGEGSSMIVTCVPPSGVPTPAVRWTDETGDQIFENRKIRARGDELIVSEARSAHEGSYICEAYNMAGRKTKQMYLIVTRVPQILEGPSSAQILEGDTARLECRIEAPSYPLSNVTWLKNNEIIIPDNYRIFASGVGVTENTESGPSTLRLRWTTPQDSGIFACQVDAVGHDSQKSSSAELIVTKRLKFSKTPEDTRLKIGKSSLLLCEAQGLTPPDIMWRRYSIKMGIQNLQSGVEDKNGMLIFYNASLEDEGKYICIASNDQGVINRTVSVTAIDPPTFEHVTRGPVEAELGKTLVLECKARGKPPPAIHWDLNQNRISLTDKRMLSSPNGTLKIESVEDGDAGIYGCTAGNVAGFTRDEILVNIIDSSSEKILRRTIGITIGGAVAYMALVGAMLLYCKQRRRHKRASRFDNATESEAENKQPDLDPLVQDSNVKVNNSLKANHKNPLINNGKDSSNLEGFKESSCTDSVSSAPRGVSQASTRTVEDSSHPSSSPAIPGGEPSQKAQSSSSQSSKSTASATQTMSLFQKDDLQILLTLGHGEFGEVQLGRMKKDNESDEATTPDLDQLVMIKIVTSKDETILAEIAREASMFDGPTHSNVTSTVVFFANQRPQILVTRYTDWGDLKQFLLATRKDTPRPVGGLRPPPLSDAHCFSLALQAADGLLFLSSRRFTHRDVAARNCLLTSSLQLKLACPALSRDAYKDEYFSFRNQILPVRWLAPEALLEDDHNMKSSVFSWAWLAWEILTQAAIPYEELTNQQVIYGAQKGELQFSLPKEVAEDYAQILMSCWSLQPKSRPSIYDIVSELREFV